MKKPRIAIIAFPGSNGEIENLRTFRRVGFDVFVFRWNDSREKLADVDGYFIGAGFSYEDRGRAGMVAARDPLFQFLHEESAKGKVIVGHCNGYQVLVESGLIPLGEGLQMCMARNTIEENGSVTAPGFLNEWIYITRTCARDRCCTADWDEPLHIPIAHGEGRFVTKDRDLVSELQKNDQIAFQYCSAEGTVSEDPTVTPNGSINAIAGICNPAGNVVAMMPHPERTTNGDVYFASIRSWIDKMQKANSEQRSNIAQKLTADRSPLTARKPRATEIYIDTLITNNEERTVEQAARRVAPELKLKQFRYLSPTEKSAEEILATIALFNPNKEVAYVQKDGKWSKWNADAKNFDEVQSPLSETTLLRRDEPDTGASGLGQGSETGVCYSVSSVSEEETASTHLQEIFGNPHASTLEKI